MKERNNELINAWDELGVSDPAYLTYTVPVIKHAERLSWRVPALCVSYKKSDLEDTYKLKILIWMIK